MDKQGRIEYAQCAQKRRAKKRRAMTDRGISFLPVENGSSMKSKWSRTFAKQVDPETKRRIYYEQYRWHIFSNGLAPCLEGREAREAFDQCLKKKVYAFYQNEDGAYLIKNQRILIGTTMSTSLML
jgi:hypothetical protein